MAFADRVRIIERIEAIRGSHVICYLTGVRGNLAVSMGEDAVRVFFDHLLKIEERPVKKIDVFLCSNGGNGVVPWRLISLLREFGKKIGVLIPYRAYSAATMFSLGADEIVMHPFAELGPIDPTVTNDYNPIDPQSQQRVGISVEDVKAYVSFIKDTVGIRHEDELIKAVEILANKVHPLALGNVERFISQSRMIARKILLTHMKEDRDGHKIDEMIEMLASKLYFHGHPINRVEAKKELGLKVVDGISEELEKCMWDLYCDFEDELQNREVFDPMSKIYQQGVLINNPQGPPSFIIPPGTVETFDNKLAFVESRYLSSCCSIEQRFVVAGLSNDLQPIIRHETLRQGWDSVPAPPAPQS
jgi:hypothetical protein